MINTSLLRPIQRHASRLAMLGLAAAGTALLAACEDPFAPRATTAVRADSFVVFSVSQTPVNAPAAFNIIAFTPVRLEPRYIFDLVFDIDAEGRVILVPVRLVGGALTYDRIVGLQKMAGNFEELTRAPSTGYVYDSTLTIANGEGAIVELYADQCQFQTSRIVYAKLQIQAVDPVTRRIAFRITYDPNCGFRSFLPGVPTN